MHVVNREAGNFRSGEISSGNTWTEREELPHILRPVCWNGRTGTSSTLLPGESQLIQVNKTIKYPIITTCCNVLSVAFVGCWSSVFIRRIIYKF